jgi:hypothetical protein
VDYSPGGKFEFLPVRVSTPGATLKAILRLGIHAGVSTETPDVGIPKFNASIGIESSIFTNVAEFVTNISVSDGKDDKEDCAVKVIEEYVSF